jgi:hypothetical protein
MYYYKKTYWLYEFVSLSLDSVKGEVLTLATTDWEYEISAESAILYKINGTDRKYSRKSKGDWKTPTQTCSNFHNKDYFETLDGYVYKELPDCHWIILKDDSFWNTCDFVQIKNDPAEGQILFLTNANNDVEIYEKNLVWNPLLHKSERHSYQGEWKSSGTELGTKLNVDPCKSLPCLNGGSCKSSTDSVSYICQCPAAYSGNNCQKRKPNK